MEAIRISDNKLKLILSVSDMERYDISCDSIGGETQRAREAVRGILREAREKSGFDAAGNRVLVQLYPERGGGCEMYVTKLEGVHDPLAENAMEAMYVFPSLDELLAACRYLALSNRDAEVYYLAERRQWYLYLTEHVEYLGEFLADRLLEDAVTYIRTRGQRLKGSLKELGALA